MTRNGLYALIGILLVAVVGLGIYIYQQQQAQPSLEIKVDDSGLTVNGSGG
jgi:hypothetical protein